MVIVFDVIEPVVPEVSPPPPPGLSGSTGGFGLSGSIGISGSGISVSPSLYTVHPIGIPLTLFIGIVVLSGCFTKVPVGATFKTQLLSA